MGTKLNIQVHAAFSDNVDVLSLLLKVMNEVSKSIFTQMEGSKKGAFSVSRD